MNFRPFKIAKIVALVIVAVGLFGFVTMQLWNWLMPPIFGLHTVTFVQALGLLILGKILFGGFHRHGGGHRGWKRHMQDRWSHLSPEERERFRAGMRNRCGGRRCGPREETAVEQPSL